MIKETVKHFAAEFENEIEKLFVTDRAEYSIVSEAMKYSLADGGKRLRPFLIDRFFKAAGGEAWEFLKSHDALIDGPFILSQKDLSLKYRGSKNQRLLHLEVGSGKIISIE